MKQRVANFSGQKLVDYKKSQVDYRMYKSTNKAYDVCVCVQDF